MPELSDGTNVRVVLPQAPDVRVHVVPVQGPPGVAGGGYTHTQAVAAAQWNVNHGLGQPREPTVLLDSAPTVPVTADVEHTDANNSIIVFDSPVTGRAYF